MKWFDNAALTLVIIGAINWLLIGIFRFDAVAWIFGSLTWISRIIHTCWTLWHLPHQSLRTHGQHVRFIIR